MKIKKTLPWVCIAVVVLWTLFSAPGRSLRAQDSSEPNTDIIAKLDMVLNNQKTILNDLAAMKEQLRIMTVRITQSQ